MHPPVHPTEPQSQFFRLGGEILEIGVVDLVVWSVFWGWRLLVKKVLNFFEEKSAPPDKILAMPMHRDKFTDVVDRWCQWIPVDSDIESPRHQSDDKFHRSDRCPRHTPATSRLDTHWCSYWLQLPSTGAWGIHQYSATRYTEIHYQPKGVDALRQGSNWLI